MPINGRIFAVLYDPSLALAERRSMRAIRQAVLSSATGRTLELGAGTGLNLPLYPPAVTSLTLTDPEPSMIRRLHRTARRNNSGVEIVQAPGEHLPFDDAVFDTVVCTLVLCTVSDIAAVLAEVSRVLAPTGQLLVIEHVRAHEPGLARWQDRLHRPWRALAHGCHCNLDIAQALTRSGLDAVGLKKEEWRGMPRIVRPVIAGRLARTVPAEQASSRERDASVRH